MHQYNTSDCKVNSMQSNVVQNKPAMHSSSAMQRQNAQQQCSEQSGYTAVQCRFRVHSSSAKLECTTAVQCEVRRYSSSAVQSQNALHNSNVGHRVQYKQQCDAEQEGTALMERTAKM